MTDKEFRRLSRPELIDIIFELQQRYEQLQSENDSLKQALEKKELAIANAGSLAEAVISINGVLEAAQAAAEQYVISIKAANSQTEQSISAAKAESERIIQEAQEKAQQIEASAKKSAALIWDDFQAKATEMAQTRKRQSVSPKEDG